MREGEGGERDHPFGFGVLLDLAVMCCEISSFATELKLERLVLEKFLLSLELPLVVFHM